MRSLGTELAHISKHFRHIQKDFFRSQQNFKHTRAHAHAHTRTAKRDRHTTLMRIVCAFLMYMLVLLIVCFSYRFCFSLFSLSDLRDQEKIGEQFFSSDTGNAVSLEDALNNGLTENQVAELAQIEAQSNDREKEIIKIAQSVNELANLFKELNMLVIEQGTVLDRIDYNIETSCQKIKKGVVDLEAANEMSKKALSTKCLVILVIIVSLLLIVFIAKASS